MNDTIDADRQRSAAERRAAFHVVRTDRQHDGRNPVDVQVGSRLRSVRKSRGVDKAFLARLIGVSERTFDLMEDGRDRLGAIHLYHLSDYLGLPVTYWFAADSRQDAIDAAYEASLAGEQGLDRGER
jgi:DNA-binding XRE family transcriptional regulator